MTDVFPYISSDDLDNTEWGKNLTSEFGRVTAEKLAMFLNKNGVSISVPISLGRLNMGFVKINFYDSDYQPVEDSNRVVRYCEVFVNGKQDSNVKSIEIPLLRPRVRQHYDIKMNYELTGIRKIDYDDEDMEDIDFDKLHSVITNSIDSLDDDLFDESFKCTMKFNIVKNYLTEIESEIDPQKVINILNNL